MTRCWRSMMRGWGSMVRGRRSVMRSWRSMMRCWRTMKRGWRTALWSCCWMMRGGWTRRGDGVCVSAGWTVSSVVEVIVRREAVTRGRGAVSVVRGRNVGRTCWVVGSLTARPPWPGVGVSPGVMMAEAKFTKRVCSVCSLYLCLLLAPNLALLRGRDLCWWW